MLEVASVAGAVFTARVCAAAAHLDPEHFEALCETLARRQHVVRTAGPYQFPDGSLSQRYAFVHTLYREVCYWRQTSGRRATLHRRHGERLEGVFATQRSDVATELAYHFEAGAAWTHAVRYLRLVADMAAQRFAHREAAATLQHAIALVDHLPEVERPQHALPLYIALGAVLQTAHGPATPEVEHLYTQARTLCQQAGETPALVPVLLGLWRFYAARPQLNIARELGDRLLRLTQPADDPALAVVGYYALGNTELWLGTLSAARQHLEAGIAHYTPDQHRALVVHTSLDPGIACQCYAALSLWLLGYPQQALGRLQEALALAHALAHPYSLAFARGRAACIYQLYRDVPAVHAHAEAAVALATAQGFPLWAAWGRSLCGWALAMQGQGEAGMTQVRQGITAGRATGAVVTVPYLYTMLAEVSAHMGHTEDGLHALAEAHTLMEHLQERWWEAEICRLRGVLFLRQPGTPQAEAAAWLQRALDVARRQEAKALELRAAMSLARLWQHQGKRTEAYDLLAPIYEWFTEGFDTADLQEAKALLEELAG
jgi:predicted ATPase